MVKNVRAMEYQSHIYYLRGKIQKPSTSRIFFVDRVSINRNSFLEFSIDLSSFLLGVAERGGVGGDSVEHSYVHDSHDRYSAKYTTYIPTTPLGDAK